MKKNSLLKKYSRVFGLILAIALMTIIFGLVDPIYVSRANLRDILDQTSIYGLMAIGMTFVIISGGIDLSVGAVLAVICVVTAKMSVAGIHPIIVVLTALAMAFCIGAVNGFMIAKMKLQPFIATMGAMSVYRGLAYILSSGLPITGVPDSFRNLVDGPIFAGIRISTFIFLVTAIILHVLLKKTRFGTSVYAIGGNQECARLSGIRVDRTLILIYAVSMVGTALSAMVQLGKLGTGEPSAGNGYELDAVAAIAIGGACMAGGRGEIIGTVFGALLMSALKVGLITSGVETYFQYVAKGLIIILAAYAEIVQNKLEIRPLKRKEKKQA